MIWYFTGGALALLIYFWGIGLAVLLMPGPWRRFWPAVCPLCGLALQALVVWIGANAGLPGTQGWAVRALVLPFGFCALAAWRVGGARRFGNLLLGGARRFWPQWLFMAFCFVLITHPLTRAPGYLSAISIGSCDAADYAGGGRVLLEFPRTDRTGFLADNEVTRLGSAANFYEFWLRLNHFTPSALLALNCPVLRCRPHELVSLLGVVLLVLNTPAVFWLARAGFRMRATAAGCVTLLYGCNPILLYAVYQTALGQLLAAPAVALLTWTGMRVFRAAHCRGAARRRRALWSWAGLLFFCHWLLLSSYNFVLLFCFAPLVAWAGARTLLTRQWLAGWRWLGCMVILFALAVAMFPARSLTILERISLFKATPFGWQIPALRPAGWLGMVANEKLTPLRHASGIGWGFVAIFLLFGVRVIRRFRDPAFARLRAGWLLAAAFLIPAFAGYGILLASSAGNSSYDAYKLFCVFYPGTLAALCMWLEPERGAPRPTFHARIGIGLIAAVIVLYQAPAARQFDATIRRSNLIVDRALGDVSRVEALPEIGSVNVLLDTQWQRLWANTFLLRRAQYFALPTYEGRQPTVLHGEWDLRDGRLLIARTRQPTDTVELNPGYYLVRRNAPGWLEPTFGSGWFPAEQRRDEHWRWAGDGAEIILHNPHPYLLRGTLRFRGRTLLDNREVTLSSTALSEGDPIRGASPPGAWSGVFGDYFRSTENLSVRLAPGRNVLRLTSPQPAREPTAADPRALMFALTRLEVDDIEPLDSSAP